MTFKLTLFGIEKTDKCKGLKPEKTYRSTEKMVKTTQQTKFAKAVKKCHAKTKTTKQFGNCMKKELKRRKN